MRRSPRRTVPAVLGGALLLPLGLAPATAGVPGASGCDVPEPDLARVEVHAALAGDGDVTEVRREATISSQEHGSCTDTDAEDPGGLPVAVAVLHSSPAAGSLEVEQLGEVDGPVTTRIAVRDRTAADRTITVATPAGDERREERIGVPHLVRISLTYPDGWSAVTPGVGGVRTDVVDGGVRIGHSTLLFPPLTGDEVVLPVTADAGRGTPSVAIEVTPVTGEEAARLAGDELDRDAAAVLAALTETGADGADRLADGTAELAAGLDELAGGTGQLADGLAEAADGGPQLRDGAAQVAAGAAELAVGMRELSAGLRPLASGAQQVADGNRQLAEQLALAAEGADALADGNEELAAGAGQVAAGTRQLSAGVAGLRDAVGALPDLGPATDALVGPVDELLAGAEAATTGIERIAAGNRELAEGNRELADGLREAAGGSRELAEGAEQVADGTEQAAEGSQQLATGAEQLAEGSAQLSDGVDAYTRGVEGAADASGQLARGADEAAGGAGELADGAAQLPAALRQATDTADRENARHAEERAIVTTGRELADDTVRAAAGPAPVRTLTTELVVAGSDPASPALLAAVLLLVVAASATGRAWHRRRHGEEPT